MPTGQLVVCCVCKRGNYKLIRSEPVTLVAREGKMFCTKCYSELLKIRLLHENGMV